MLQLTPSLRTVDAMHELEELREHLVSTATHIIDENTLAIEDVSVTDVARIRQSGGSPTPEATTPDAKADCGGTSTDAPPMDSCFVTGRSALAAADAAVLGAVRAVEIAMCTKQTDTQPMNELLVTVTFWRAVFPLCFH